MFLFLGLFCYLSHSYTINQGAHSHISEPQFLLNISVGAIYIATTFVIIRSDYEW